MAGLACEHKVRGGSALSLALNAGGLEDAAPGLGKSSPSDSAASTLTASQPQLSEAPSGVDWPSPAVSPSAAALGCLQPSGYGSPAAPAPRLPHSACWPAGGPACSRACSATTGSAAASPAAAASASGPASAAAAAAPTASAGALAPVAAGWLTAGAASGAGAASSTTAGSSGGSSRLAVATSAAGAGPLLPCSPSWLPVAAAATGAAAAAAWAAPAPAACSAGWQPPAKPRERAAEGRAAPAVGAS